MRAVVFAAFALATTAGVYACSAFSGSDDGAPSTDAASADRTTTTNDATLGPDAANIVDGGGVDAGAANSDLFDDDFENDQDDCIGWILNVVTAKVSTAFAYTGQKSCLVCLSGSTNINITRNIAFDASAGPFELDFYMLTLVDAGARRGAADITAYADSGAQVAGGNTYIPLNVNQWKLIQLVSAPTGGGGYADTANINIYDDPEVPNECFYIDDVRFFVQH